jgi:FtsH-binding integral membrane protein
MSTQTSSNEAIAEALSGDAELQTRKERIIAGRIFVVLAIVAALVSVAVAFFGLPALTMVALVATVVMMVLLIAYAAGF